MSAFFAKRALSHNLKSLNLTTVKQVNFSFDPFSRSCESIREIMYIFHASKYRKTNLNTGYKVDVKADRSSPTMEVKFNDDQKAMFKTENLSALDIVVALNKLCSEKEQAKGIEKK